jgi:hypothetical protein
LKDSYLTAGIKLDQLFRLISRNRITVKPRTLLRLAFLLQSAVWSSFFSWIESARYKKALMRAAVPDNPIFIIGHWRTGSTYLHQLMNLDPQLKAPTLFEVAVPDSFLVSYPYYRPIFRKVVSRHRPMDQVKIGMDEPQEDEYALYRITSFSPLENLVFPKSGGYFLNHGSRFFPAEEQLPAWKARVKDFYTKLYFKSNKRIISKNPFNSFRIKLLLELFPNAKFIHITRDPFCVIPSTIHMWDILRKQNSMNDLSARPDFHEVTIMLRKLLETIETARKELPQGTLVEVRFEELETSPVEVLKTLYSEIGLTFTDEFASRVRAYNLTNEGYQKNTFSLTEKEKAIIASELNDLPRYHEN